VVRGLTERVDLIGLTWSPNRRNPPTSKRNVTALHGEYCTRNEGNNTVFYLYLACFENYIHLEYVRINSIYRVHQADNVIHGRVVAPQEYVVIY